MFANVLGRNEQHYRRPSTDGSNQVSVNLAKLF